MERVCFSTVVDLNPAGPDIDPERKIVVIAADSRISQ